jgi:hypothetical protein
VQTIPGQTFEMQGKLLFELIGGHSMELGLLQRLYKFCTTFSGTKNTHEQAIFLISHKHRPFFKVQAIF